MKRFLRPLLMLAVVVAACIFLNPTKAHAASVSDLTFTLNNDGNSYSVTGCNTSARGALTIPATYNELPVTAIGDYAFYSCDSLISVTIGNSVTTIGDFAFSWCDGLTSVTILGSVTTIGDSAFRCCSRLSSTIIGNGVKSIGEEAFFYCRSLTSVIIPDSVVTLGVGVFSSCESLTSVIIPNSITSIGDSTFSGCISLAGITIPDSVTSIDSFAFRECTSLTNVTIPDSVTDIGAHAFRCCYHLTSVIIGNGVKSIGKEAFYWCTSLTCATIGNSVKSIGAGAFQYCCSLTSLTISDNVTTIDAGAFFNCKNLTTVTIPNSVTSISDNAFKYCDRLADVYFKGTQAQWDAIRVGSYNDKLKSALLHFVSDGGAANGIGIEYDGDIFGYIPSQSFYINGKEYKEYIVRENYKGLSEGALIYVDSDDFLVTDTALLEKLTYISMVRSNIVIAKGSQEIVNKTSEIIPALAVIDDLGNDLIKDTISDAVFSNFKGIIAVLKVDAVDYAEEYAGFVASVGADAACYLSYLTNLNELVNMCIDAQKELLDFNERVSSQVDTKGLTYEDAQEYETIVKKCNGTLTATKEYIEYLVECASNENSTGVMDDMLDVLADLGIKVLGEGGKKVLTTATGKLFGKELAEKFVDGTSFAISECMDFYDLHKAAGSSLGIDVKIAEYADAYKLYDSTDAYFVDVNKVIENVTILTEGTNDGQEPESGHTQHFVGASYTENIIAATCTSEGHYDKVICCAICEVEFSRVTIMIPATGHTEKIIPGKAPTCTETGLTDGKKCAVCGKVLLAREVVPTTGHSYTNYIPNGEGNLIATCDNGCGATDIKVDPNYNADLKMYARVAENGLVNITLSDGVEFVTAIIYYVDDYVWTHEIGEVTWENAWHNELLPITTSDNCVKMNSRNGYIRSNALDAMPQLRRNGSYVFRMQYLEDGVKKTIVQVVTVEQLTYNFNLDYAADGKVLITEDKGYVDKIYVYYIGADKFSGPIGEVTWKNAYHTELIGYTQKIENTLGNEGKAYRGFGATTLPRLSTSGTYVLRVVYTDPSGTEKTKIYIKEMDEVCPALSYDVAVDANGKATLVGELSSVKKVAGYYIGSDTYSSTLGEVIYFEGAPQRTLLTLGKAHPEAFGTGGYRSFAPAKMGTFSVKGNYIFRVVYTDYDGVQKSFLIFKTI